MARLDYLFCSRDLLTRITDTEIHEIALSDHAPIALTVGNALHIPDFRLWRFPSYLYNNDNFQQYLRQTWMDYADTNALHLSAPALYWEASKAYMRGKIMSYVTAYKRKAHRSYLEASDRLRCAQVLLSTHPSLQTKDSWTKAKREFELWDHRISILKSSYGDLTINMAIKLGKY